MDKLLQRDMPAMTHAVRVSCEIKARVVSADEREGASGIRATLNFGHTFGHAIEAGLGFGVWLHGEAVGCGMVMASRLSQSLGYVDAAFVERVTKLLVRAGLPVVGPASISPEEYLHHMSVDKKADGGQIKFVLIDWPGHAKVQAAPDELVIAALK
jgi:3-dehydroquinate synthase